MKKARDLVKACSGEPSSDIKVMFFSLVTNQNIMDK